MVAVRTMLVCRGSAIVSQKLGKTDAEKERRALSRRTPANEDGISNSFHFEYIYITRTSASLSLDSSLSNTRRHAPYSRCPLEFKVQKT